MNKTPDIIVLCGYKGSGKSEVATRLRAYHDYALVKQAHTIKKWCKELLMDMGCREDLANEYVDGSLKETPTQFLMKRTPRQFMQWIGTEFGRNMIHPDIWAQLAAHRCEQHIRTGGRVVLDDVRFDNEIKYLKDLGDKTDAKVVTVWIERFEAKPQDFHASEVSLGQSDCDYVIMNNSNIENLFRLTDEIVSGSISELR